MLLSVALALAAGVIMGLRLPRDSLVQIGAQLSHGVIAGVFILPVSFLFPVGAAAVGTLLACLVAAVFGLGVGYGFAGNDDDFA